MRILILGLTVFTLVTAVAVSQVSTGTINVEVQDSTGAVVPGATVDLTHVSTSQARQGKDQRCRPVSGRVSSRRRIHYLGGSRWVQKEDRHRAGPPC